MPVIVMQTEHARRTFAARALQPFANAVPRLRHGPAGTFRFNHLWIDAADRHSERWLGWYKAAGLTKLVLHKPDSAAEDMERAAIDAAETENRDQGIEPMLAFAAVEFRVCENRRVAGQRRDWVSCEAGESETEACCQTGHRRRFLAFLVRTRLGTPRDRERGWDGRAEGRQSSAMGVWMLESASERIAAMSAALSDN